VAAGVFAGTNIDDLVMLTVLFLQSRAAGRPRPVRIWVGQYAGIGALVAVSAVAALGLSIVPDEWVGLLGLVPFALGARGLVATIRARHAEGGPGRPPAVVASGALAVAGVTIANGADNISVYTPLLRTIGPADGLLTAAVFAALTAVWCLAGSWLGGRRPVVELIRRSGHWLVPAVFLLLGAVIVVQSGVPGLD
jgi:cadmium resistance protein CadD (predicted permease)